MSSLVSSYINLDYQFFYVCLVEFPGLSACSICSAGTFSGSPPDGMKIVNIQSLKCLMPLSGSTSNGVKVVTATCNGSTAQYWQLTTMGQKRYTLINAQSKLCLNDPGYSTIWGTVLVQWYCDTTSQNAFWTLSYDVASNSWIIINVFATLSLNASTADGTGVVLYPYGGGANMRWRFELGW